MIIEETHACTSCGKELTYENKVSWMNARTKLNRTGILRCQPCAGKEGRAASNKKIPGRPKGSKNSYKVKKGREVIKNIGWHRFSTRMLQVAKRNGFASYEEYRTSLDAWRAYKIDVWRITNQQPLHLLENYDRRGINGENGAYTLDHIISIRKGFNEGISPERIGGIQNLQMLPWLDNITKGWK